MSSQQSFDVVETTIGDIHAAYRSGALTARRLVELYLERIAAYDKMGPAINAVIALNPQAFAEADRLDAAYKASGFVGPLHGIPVLIKDQADVAEMPTTLGSVLFKDHRPGRDAFVVARLKQAGAIFIGKGTLGELGAGDTHGSLFGSTRNVYDLERTAGGSSGGPAASISANFATVAVAQEGLASISRPSAWNGIAGLRPTGGLVSRTGVFAGWPSIIGSLGPMARTVTDLALLLDGMVGYDPADPVTAHGHGHAPRSYTEALDRKALSGARLGVLRGPIGKRVDAESEDFAKLTAVFDKAIADLRAAGSEIVDPVEIPDLRELITKRASDAAIDDQAYRDYLSGSANPPFASREEVLQSPLLPQLAKHSRERLQAKPQPEAHHEYLKARDTLMTRYLQVMADHRLDAFLHMSVEHQPTLIRDGVNPPYINQAGAMTINTFLTFIPSMVVPAGFTRDGLPTGITFLGRPYDDARMIGFAFAYEQATRHRRAPESAPRIDESHRSTVRG